MTSDTNHRLYKCMTHLPAAQTFCDQVDTIIMRRKKDQASSEAIDKIVKSAGEVTPYTKKPAEKNKDPVA